MGISNLGAVIRSGLLVMLAGLLSGCPLPYEFSPQGLGSSPGGVDPSTPTITASPTFSYSESAGGSGVLANGQSVPTSSDTTVWLTSETSGATIYYTTDLSNPDPRSAQTGRFSSPLAVSIPNPSVSLSSKSVTIKAIAIGSNMKPSLLTSATVNLQYPQAVAPVFGRSPGSQIVTLSTTTSGASIYYLTVNGTGPAPRPVPGQTGILYTGPLVLPGSGAGTVSVTAIAVKSQLIESQNTSFTFSSVELSAIVAKSPVMTSTPIDNSDGNVLPVGEQIYYQTSSGNYGALVILDNNSDGNHGIRFDFTTYDSSGNVVATGANVQCRGTWLFDLDYQPNGLEGVSGGMDFQMENQTSTVRSLAPNNGARFFLNGVVM